MIGYVRPIRFRLLLAVALFEVGRPALPGTPLPFSVDDREWKPTVVQKEVAPGVTLEAIITHVGAPDRLIVMSSPKTDDQPAALAAFAHRLKGAFTAYRSANLTERNADNLGYSGHALRFQLANARETLDCELFAFADGPLWWAVLYARPSNPPAGAAAVRNRLAILEKKSSGVVTMAPFRVKNIPVSSFPLDLEITRNAAGDRVAGIVVTGVAAGSLAEQAGIHAGDAIVAINGRKAEEFAAGVDKDSEIGRIFLNRSAGESVQLEIRPLNPGEPITVTLAVERPIDVLRRRLPVDRLVVP